LNYYKKLLTSYIFLPSFFLVLITIVFLSGYHVITRQKHAQSTEIVFSQACEYSDQKLASLREIIRLLSTSKNARQYASEDPQNPSRYNRLQLCKELANVVSISQPNCTILVTKAIDGHYCSNYTTGEMNDLNYGIKNLSLSNEEFQNIIDSFSASLITDAQFIPIKNSDGEEKCIIAVRLIFNNRYPLYVFASYDQEDLFLIKNSDNYGFALCQEKQIIMHSGSFSKQKILHLLENNKINEDYQQNTAFYNQKFTYVLVDEQESALTFTLFLIITICIIAWIIIIVLMTHLTKHMYAPILQLLNVSKQAETDDIQDMPRIISTSDEFDIIHNNLSSLMNNISVLESQLQQYHNPAQLKFIHDLLIGLIPEEQLTNLYAKYKITDIHKNYIVALVQINNLESAFADIFSISCTIRNKILKAIEVKSTPPLYCSIDLTQSEQAYIFYSSDASLVKEIFRCALHDSLPTCSSNITIAIGSVCDDLSLINHSFFHASQLVTQAQHSTVPAQILVYGEEKDNLSTAYSVFYPIHTEQALIRAVVNGKQNTWQTLLKNLIDRNRLDNANNLLHLSMMLTATIDRILHEANLNTEVIWKKQLIQLSSMQTCKSYDALYEKSFNFLLQLSESMEEVTQTDSLLVRNKLLEFIHTNYTQDISLLDLAEHLNMSKSYVSVLFKEMVGRNFKDYLSEYRVMKACEIISAKNGKVKLLDVASAVGCNSSSLQRLFSHYKGMSPTEWIANEFQKTN